MYEIVIVNAYKLYNFFSRSGEKKWLFQTWRCCQTFNPLPFLVFCVLWCLQKQMNWNIDSLLITQLGALSQDWWIFTRLDFLFTKCALINMSTKKFQKDLDPGVIRLRCFAQCKTMYLTGARENKPKLLIESDWSKILWIYLKCIFCKRWWRHRTLFLGEKQCFFPKSSSNGNKQ